MLSDTAEDNISYTRVDFTSSTLMALMKVTAHNYSHTVKGKGHPISCREDPEGKDRYSSILSSTSAPDGGGWSKRRSGLFTTGNNTVPIV